jgi:hypothetical protein
VNKWKAARSGGFFFELFCLGKVNPVAGEIFSRVRTGIGVMQRMF